VTFATGVGAAVGTGSGYTITGQSYTSPTDTVSVSFNYDATTAGTLSITAAELNGNGTDVIGAGAPCGTNDICASGATSATLPSSPCGFNVCAGGTVADPATKDIVPVERSDASGTTQTFEARILGAASASTFEPTTAALAFSGCGSNNLLSDCGISVPTTGNGNPGVISAVGANLNAIGYASDGLVRATGSGVGIVPFAGVGQSALSGAGVTFGGVTPSLGATGTISYGVQLENGATLTASQNPYAGVRPFEWITTNTPTGEVQRLLEYVLDPANNQNFATESSEVSIYSI
jgi:hypothetical protein